MTNYFKHLHVQLKPLLLALLCSFSIYGQTENDSIKESKKPYPIKSLPDLFKKKDSVAVLKPTKSNFFIIVPVIGSEPATGFKFGLTGQYTFKSSPDAKYSTINAGYTYTTLNQQLINVKNNVFLKHDKLFLSGDWRFYVFSQANYGLGSDIIPASWRNNDFKLESIKEPMEYDYVKIHQTFSWLVSPHFYVGTGLHLDGYTNINDEYLAANGTSHHYEYSKNHGFSNKEYYVNGVSLNLVYDTRDNPINTNNGVFANLNFRQNPSFGKNQYVSNMISTDIRYFIPMSEINKQHVLGFWMVGQFLTGGNVPYLNLPANGWDQRSRSGKGYVQGLIRGQSLVTFETEYRFPITRNQLISGTVFANATTASDQDRDLKLFKFFQPAAGIGLRILIDKKTLTNLILNYGWGRDSKAFYLNAGETF